MNQQQQQQGQLNQRQPQSSHQQYQDRQQHGNIVMQRREFLWRERVKLELQVQALMARAESLEQAWRVHQQRKDSMQQKKPKLVTQIVLSSLARTRSPLPAERLFHYERERLIQEEERLRQAMLLCQGDLAGLQAQIEVISLELTFLV